jgi:hypothetical protein
VKFRVRSSKFQVAFVAFIGVVTLAAAPPQAPANTTSSPYAGLIYFDRLETTPRAVHLHVVQIDSHDAGLRFALSPPGGAREVVRQTTLEYLNATHAQVAINAHYFLPYPTTETDVEVIGLAVSDGRVISGFETPVQRYALVTDAPAINLDASNRASIVHRAHGNTTVAAVRERVTLWTAVAGSAQIVTDGKVTIPMYADATHPTADLVAGGPGNYSNERSWLRRVQRAHGDRPLARRAHAHALHRGRARRQRRVDRRRVATRLIRDFGVWNALNLDGGGSTSMAMEDRSRTSAGSSTCRPTVRPAAPSAPTSRCLCRISIDLRTAHGSRLRLTAYGLRLTASSLMDQRGLSVVGL